MERKEPIKAVKESDKEKKILIRIRDSISEAGESGLKNYPSVRYIRHRKLLL